MNESPLVSVVIPAFNAEKYIDKTLQSVLKQTFQDFEIVVVDDGSTDNTRVILERYSERVICLSNDHRGPANSRNRGLDAARGSLIAFLDADDLWLPQKLQRQVSVARQNQECGLITCDAQVFDERGILAHSSKARQPIANGDVLRQLLSSNWVGTSCAMVPKKCFAKVGNFDEEPFRWGEDWIMWLKIAAEYPVHFIDQVLVQYRVHPKSYSNVTADKHFVDLIYNLEKLEKQVPRLATQPELMREAKARLCCRAAWRDLQNLRVQDAREKSKSAVRYRKSSLLPWTLLTISHLPSGLLHLLKRTLKFVRNRFAQAPKPPFVKDQPVDVQARG